MRLPITAALCLIATAGLAEDERLSVDLMAMIVAGIAAEETAQVGSGLTAYVQQSGPGRFFGNTEEDGVAFAFSVTEPETCVFEVTMQMGADPAMGIRIDAKRITSIAFEQGDDITGYTNYSVELIGDDVVSFIGRDGDPGNSTQMGTSLTLEELNAAALALPCPPR